MNGNDENTKTQQIHQANILTKDIVCGYIRLINKWSIYIPNEIEWCILQFYYDLRLPHFIDGLLQLECTEINDEMIEELLTKQDITDLLMSYISRMPKKHQTDFDNLSIDFDTMIPSTLPLYSNKEQEIHATKLSYSLLSILSNGNNLETPTSFLLKECDLICAHALAVYHPSSNGNVYHARLILEILLSLNPKLFIESLINTKKPYIQSLLKCALFRNLHQGNFDSFVLDLISCDEKSNKTKLLQLFVEWNFIEYILSICCNTKYGDDIATKYASFFINMIARCASIKETKILFIGKEDIIIDSFMNCLLDKEYRSKWHRVSIAKTLIQCLDILCRPKVIDEMQSMAAIFGMPEPQPKENMLYPMLQNVIKRVNVYIPSLCQLITNQQQNARFGQIRLQCFELLITLMDITGFKSADVLASLTLNFWNELLDMTFMYSTNNFYLCNVARLIHFATLFRRRILKHLFMECKMLQRFVEFYRDESLRCALHAYIIQILWDIYTNDRKDDDDDDGDDNKINETNDDDDMDIASQSNFSKDAEDQWDIVAYFDSNEIWKEFKETVSTIIEIQSNDATPNYPNATQQVQSPGLQDLLCGSLLKPYDSDDSDDSSTDSDDSSSTSTDSDD